MNKTRIIGIVLVMALSLLGLVVLQVHWVRSALTLKEQEFDKNVFDAMYEVVLENKKAVTASLVRSFIETKETVDQRLIIINGDTIVMPEGQWVAADVADMPPELDVFPERSMQAHFGAHVPWDEDMPPGAVQRSMRAEIVVPNAQWYEQVLRHLASELPMMTMPTTRAVDMADVRVLLARKLDKRGIDLDFELAINRVGTSEILCEARSCTTEEVLASNYRANMFPDQLLSQPTFLHVHFPKKFGFLLRSMWIRLGTSVMLILLITGCFAFVVWTIFRQKKLSDMKNDFINNMTHELKTPIATLSLAGQAIGDPGMDKDAGRLSRFGGMIREESAKLGAHVERILQIAVIDQGDMALAVEPVDMHELVSRLAAAYHLRLQRPGDSLVTHLQAEHSTVQGDPMHLSNMIDNLLDNAVKYSKPERIDVVVSTHNAGRSFVLEVADQGVGMKKDTLKRIFEKFYRVPSGNVHNVKGFGLGLSYVKYVLDAHQGTVSVKSSPDHGSTFKITLPT